MTDVLIIGAGPSGSTAAAFLVRQGFKVLVLERQKFPRFSIGESMLPASMEFIEKAGMMEAVMGASFQYKDGAVFHYRGQVHQFKFPLKFSPGPGFTFEVPRDEFDKILIDEAERQGAQVRYEVEITAVDFTDGKPTVTARTKDGTIETHRPRFVLDASGFGRTLPRLLDLETPSNFPVRSALFTQVYDHIPSGAFDRQKILVVIHPERRDVWFWVIPFSNGRVSMGVVASAEFHDRYQGTPEQRLWTIVNEVDSLRELLKHAKPANPVGELRGYAANVKALHGPGWALLGNAAEFLDPVFSSGVCIAMKSADLAADVLGRQLRGQPVDWENEFAKPLKIGVETFRGFVEHWYDGGLADIFFHPRKNEKIQRMICSVLAGYGWDTNNPYVGVGKRRLTALVEACRGGADMELSMAS
ncbi:NAD(P)/FAD-dependent oxidoreductase [Fontimonas sp. SYSU GA230001]|uniref:NAD(P)/FAD-dependent oxidoreductase n=1 Tax=Fontimonas sp. SYSU GA230001 TaxID=3142450 RepID=UPI0032B3D23D